VLGLEGEKETLNPSITKWQVSTLRKEWKKKLLNPSWLTKLQDICFVNGRERSPLSSNP
jgi:hypothetical protein